jgi:Family of unknown function (DUF6683)
MIPEDHFVKKVFCAPIIVFAISLAAEGQQQWTNPYTGNKFNNPMSSYLDTVIMHNIQRRMLERSLREKSSQQQSKTNYDATSFQPQNKMLIWDSMDLSNMTPEQQKQTADLYAALLKSFDDNLIEEGQSLRRNNVTTAFIYLIVASHFIRTGEELTDPQQEALFEQFYSLLSTDPAFTQTDNARKQMMYEAMVSTAGLMLVFDQQSKENGDAELAQSAKSLANDSWKLLFGEAADKYTINADGAIVTVQ